MLILVAGLAKARNLTTNNKECNTLSRAYLLEILIAIAAFILRKIVFFLEKLRMGVTRNCIAICWRHF